MFNVHIYFFSEILDKASQCTDNYEQMAYVAAFTVSAYRYRVNFLSNRRNFTFNVFTKFSEFETLEWGSFFYEKLRHFCFKS